MRCSLLHFQTILFQFFANTKQILQSNSENLKYQEYFWNIIMLEKTSDRMRCHKPNYKQKH